MLRSETAADPARMETALAGLRRYQEAARAAADRADAGAGRARSARRCATMAARVRRSLFVPSLINPPNVLDLGEPLAAALAGGAGRRVLLLDWGWPGPDRAGAVGRRPCRGDRCCR